MATSLGQRKKQEATRACPRVSGRAPRSLAEGQAAVGAGLQVLGVVVVGGAQVDAVLVFGDFYGFLPLTGGPVELVEKVVALAFLVQLLSLLLKKGVHVSAATALAPTRPTADATRAANQPMTEDRRTFQAVS